MNKIFSFKSIIYFIVTFFLIFLIGNIISFFSPILPQYLICSIIIVLIILYNFFYIKAIFSQPILGTGDRWHTIIIFAILIVVIPSIYALVYSHFYEFNPNLFSTPDCEKLNLADFYYFSMSTFATVGYGDIVVKSTPLRMVVSLEIINGIAFLIIGVANIEFIKSK